jgi:soluble lytic murein transglycosylase-like protein
MSPSRHRPAPPARLRHRARLALAGTGLACAAALAPADAQASAGLEGIVARKAEAHGVAPSLALAVVRIESGFRPTAVNRGNYGLMQIRLGTARSLGYGGTAAGLLQPETNLAFGLRYLAQAHRLAGGDLCGTLMRYQSGLRATRMTAANRAYCAKARTIMARAGA